MPDTSQSHRKSLLAFLAGVTAGALVVTKMRSAGHGPAAVALPPTATRPAESIDPRVDRPVRERPTRSLPTRFALATLFALPVFAGAAVSALARDDLQQPSGTGGAATAGPAGPAAQTAASAAATPLSTDTRPAQSNPRVPQTAVFSYTAPPAQAAAPAASRAAAGARPRARRRHRRIAPVAAVRPPSAVRRSVTRAFARRVLHTARARHTDWSLVLGVLQTEHTGGLSRRSPSGTASLARRLASASAGASRGREAAAATVLHDAANADRAVTFARYDRAVGVETLVEGLAASKRYLARRVLADRRIHVYGPGRTDLASGRVDPRVEAVIAYLGETFGSVEVSSLVSGHRLYARPGVVSAHVAGRAVDIVALGGVPIQGHQQPGGIADRAVRALLQLPQGLEPAQVISLLALGGPSFALSDHYDHIHIGY